VRWVGVCVRQVRQLAREAGLSTAERRESMGICFIGKRRWVCGCVGVCACWGPLKACSTN
jgi:hypothetical protein